MAQKRIVMEREGGVYKIPCKVNGAKMKMIFDTGASSVSISSSIAQYLYDNDYITKNDILGTAKAQVADGRIVNNVIINLRDVEIDGIHVKNVEAIVSESLAAPLLFGQSAIQKLGKISLSGNILTIENYTNNYTEKQIAELESKIDKAYNNENFYLAAKYITEAERLCGITAEGYKKLSYCYLQLDDVDNCIDAVKRFENNCPDDVESEDAADIYMFLGNVLDAKNHYSEAISAYQKSIAIYMKFKNWECIGVEYMNIGIDYREKKECLKAIDSFKKAISYYTKHLRISDNGIKKNENLALLYDLLSTEYAIYYSDDRNPTSISYLQKAAQCGSESSIKELKEMGFSINE